MQVGEDAGKVVDLAGVDLGAWFLRSGQDVDVQPVASSFVRPDLETSPERTVEGGQRPGLHLVHGGAVVEVGLVVGQLLEAERVQVDNVVSQVRHRAVQTSSPPGPVVERSSGPALLRPGRAVEQVRAITEVVPAVVAGYLAQLVVGWPLGLWWCRVERLVRQHRPAAQQR